MDNLGGPSMSHVTLLLFLLGAITLVSVHGVDLNHLKKGGCSPNKDTMFPSTMKVSLNMSRQSHVPGGDMRTRSISPWEYIFDVNNNRIPHVIAEAHCLHTGCLDSEGKVDISMSSVAIRQEILVLHREMKGCVPVFKLEKKMVTVGCTCVRPNIREQL